MRPLRSFARRNYVTLALCAIALLAFLGSGLYPASGSKAIPVVPGEEQRAWPVVPDGAAMNSLPPAGTPGDSRGDALKAKLRPASMLSPFATTLTATKTDNVSTPVDPGATIMYTIEITNTGAMDATNVNLTDTIDANTTLVPGSVVASPIAVNDAYNTIGNVHISVPVAQGVIANDFNPNGSGTLAVTLVNATAVPGTAATTNGSVTMAADGSFTYTPTAGFGGPTDTFTYTLGNGTGKVDTATVTITIAGKIWFVNSAAGVNGDGRLNTPFNILTGAGSADSVDAANDVIFLYSSGTNYTGGITLNSAEKVIGQGASLSILTITGFAAPSGTNLLPATSGADPVIITAGTTAITLGTGNGLHGFTVGNTGAAGTDISGTSFGTLTVRDVTVNGTGRALNLATGTMAAGSTFDLIESNGGSPSEGVRLNTVGGSFASPTTNIVNPTGTGLDVQSSPAGTNFSFGGTTVNKGASVGTGVNLASNLGTFSFSSLAVTTSNGTGVSATSSGTVNVTTGSIASTGGPALVVNPTAIGMTFTTVSSTNSGTTGISLTSASGSLSIGTTTITNPTGIGISVNTSSATLNFGNTTANLSGGTGVSLTTNTGTITFADLDIAPDANQKGLLATENTTTITTTSGTISTATGNAVEITKASGATPLAMVLTSVSANGGTSGIILTRTNGSFSVNGTGTAGTGGTIQATTSHGVALNTVQNLTLSFVNIQNTGADGINATSATGITLNGAQIIDAGNGDNENGMTLVNCGGTVSMQGTTINNVAEEFIEITSDNNSNLTLNVGTVTGCTFTLPNTLAAIRAGGAFAGNGILVTASGTSNYNLNIGGNAASKNNFNNIKGFAIQFGSTGSGSAGTWTGNDTNINVDDNLFTTTVVNVLGNTNNRANTINFQAFGSGDLDLNVRRNTISGGGGGGIQIGVDNTAHADATITNNSVSNQFADGILIAVDESASLNVLIDSNTISNTSSDGMEIANAISPVPAGTATLNATITNNTVTGHNQNQGANSFFAGIGVFSGTAGDITRVDIRNNAVSGNANPASFFDYALDGSSFGGGIVVKGNGVAAVTEAAFLAPGNGTNNLNNTAAAPAGSKTFIGQSTFNNNAIVPQPMSVGQEFVASTVPLPDHTENKSELRATWDAELIDDSIQKLRQEQLNWIVQAAIERWRLTNISAEDLARLEGVTFELADLPNTELAKSDGTRIKIDETAASYGWYFDETPQEDGEFQVIVPDKELQTDYLSPANGKMDLLTVVMRELGHIYLRDKDRVPKSMRKNLQPLMEDTLSTGVRRLPLDQWQVTPPTTGSMKPSTDDRLLAQSSSTAQADATQTASLGSPTAEIPADVRYAVFNPSASLIPGDYGRSARRVSFMPAARSVSQSKNAPSGSPPGFNKALGTIPVGEKVVIMFSVTVADPFLGATPQVCNQGTVTADGGINITTTDPGPPVVNGPTCTQINLPDVTVAVAPSSTPEDGAGNLVYTFTRTGSTTGAISVNFSVGGTATPPGGATPDYSQTGAATFTTTSGTVTIPAGSASAAVTVDPTTDAAFEPDETVILTVLAGTGYEPGTPASAITATGTITNDDTEVSVAVAPASTLEDGAGNLVFTFTRQGLTAGALTANFTIGGTATPPGGATPDYTQTGAATFVAPNGTVTFAAGSPTAVVTIDPTTDTTVEPNETVILTVVGGTGYTVGTPAAATGTINNDDADVSVAVAPTSSLEDTGPNMVYTFTRTGFTGAALTINFTVGGTAVFINGAGTDYTQTGAATFTATTGTVTFTGTNTTATVTIDPATDTTGEPDETVILTVVSGTGYNAVAPTSATGTILNDDTAVSVAVSPASSLEDTGPNMVYTFTRTGDTSTALLVNFSVGGTAVFVAGPTTDYTQTGADSFTPTTGTITIPIGSATAAVTIDPATDLTVEPDETVILTVTAGSGYAPGPPNPATGTITNDDTDVSIAVSPASVAEDGAPNLVYTFTRTGVTTGALTVNFSVGGTATPPGGATPDYSQTGAATFTPPTGTVTFTGSNTTAVITVDPTGDNAVESDETVILTVAAGTGYNVAGANFSATGTITNDDATVSVAVSPASVVEDSAGVFTYTFTRAGFTGGPLTVNFDTVGSTASATSDYAVSGTGVTFVPGTGLGTVTFSGSSTTTTMTVDPATDAIGEPNETVIVNIAAGTNYTATAPVSATGTILDDDTSVGVTVAPASVLENSGTAMVYTFTRTGDTTSALSVNFTATGTASPSNDYAVTGTGVTFDTGTGLGTIAIGSGVTMVTANVTPNGDLTVEANETVIITVTAGTGYIPNSGTPSATGTITNDDTDVSVMVSPSSVAENSGTGLVYTFTRTGVTTGTLTVNFTVGGTAQFTTDYTQAGADTFTPPTGTVTFANNIPTALVTITPVGDNTVELDETVILGVAAGAGYNIAASNNSATGTITNDDADVSVAVSPAAVAEDGAPNLTYTFTRSGFTGGPLTVNFAASGTASPTSDYTVTGSGVTFVAGTGLGTVTFTTGNTTAAVTVDPSADGSPESHETVILTIAAGTNYTPVNPTSATGTILDDDTSVSVAVSPVSVMENSGTSMVYTFTRTGDTSAALLVNFSVGGGASFPTDYGQSGATSFTPPSGSVTIGAGLTMAQVSVTPVGDSTVEPDETVVLTVVAGAGYNVGAPSVATGTIVNDDTDVTVAVSPASTLEDGAGNLVYTFTRAGVTTGALTVNFSVGGTATPPGGATPDYSQTGAATFTTTSGTATFGAGNSTVQVTVDPTTDTTVEPDETVILTVTAGAGYNVGAPATATGTITNDDTDVTLAVAPLSVTEAAGTLVYTFTRSGVTATPLTVNFSVGGTATFTSDYTQTGAATFGASSGTVTITAGNTTATVTLTPVNDALVEGSETAVLALTAGGYGIGVPNTATGTITDNDMATIAFAASSSNAPEQTTPHNVGVTLVITANGAGTPMLARVVTVNVQDLGTGTATGGGVDYTFTNPTMVSFNIGDVAQTKTVSIAIVNDLMSEGNETINLALNTLVDGTGGQVSLASPTADTVTIVDNDIDLKVTKAESVDPVAAGSGPGNLTYTITLKNVGLTGATGVALSEVLTIPTGVTVDSVTGSAGTTVTPIDATHYTWNVGSLAVNNTATLTAVLTAGASAMSGTNSICDTATVTASNEVRVNTGDDAATECTSVVAQADLEITAKTDAPDPVCVEGTITYTIGLKNNGPGPGLSTTMTDPVPPGTTFVSAMVTSGTGWSRTDSVPVGGTGNIVFSKASVGIGETATFQIVVMVNTGTVHGTVITNTATANAQLIDPTPGNNSKTAMTTVDPIAPVIVCPANITVSTDADLCSAVVNYPAPTVTDNCPCGGNAKKQKKVLAACPVVCTPPSGSTFAKGTTTVTCMATDVAGNQSTCSFTVTVNDTQPPTITCPANVTTKTPNPGDPCVVVNYTTPSGADNCAGVTVVCNPPSGSCFPLGATTVTCTATDTSSNTATCTFKVTVFDLCIQNDNGDATLLINSATGDYRFCCSGVIYTGRGTVVHHASTFTLTHNPSDRRVLATIDDSTHKATASIQAPPGTQRCTISDRDTQNNSCVCQ